MLTCAKPTCLFAQDNHVQKVIWYNARHEHRPKEKDFSSAVDERRRQPQETCGDLRLHERQCSVGNNCRRASNCRQHQTSFQTARDHSRKPHKCANSILHSHCSNVQTWQYRQEKENIPYFHGQHRCRSNCRKFVLKFRIHLFRIHKRTFDTDMVQGTGRSVSGGTFQGESMPKMARGRFFRFGRMACRPTETHRNPCRRRYRCTRCYANMQRYRYCNT